MKNKINLHHLGLILLPFVASQIVLSLVLHYEGQAYLSTTNWSRWDSGHYLSIAENGYEYFRCSDRFSDYPKSSTHMCGNTGWFPTYSLLIWLTSIFGGKVVLIGGMVSKMFYIATIWMVTILLDLKVLNYRNLLITSSAAFFYGYIYYNAIFPVSCLLFFTLLAFYFYKSQKNWQTAGCCFVAATLYPSGFLLGISFGLTTLLKTQLPIKERFKAMWPPIAMGFLGVICVFGWMHISVGDWAAFINAHQKYGQGAMVQNPLYNLESHIMNMKFGLPIKVEDFVNFQTLLVIASYLLVSYHFFYRRMYHDTLYLWSYLYLSFFFLYPWTTGGTVSSYRAESLLLPLIFFTSNLKIKWLEFIFLVLFVLGIGMSHLFFSNVLV